MSLMQLAWKNISGNRLRSWIVALCALVVAAFTLFATLFLRGAATSLELAADRLGADIVVMPQGAETKMEGALMMGAPAQFWMPAGNVGKLAAIPGIAAVSPQVYLATLKGASCCSFSEMFMVAYDPQTDFTVRPWLDQELHGGLGVNEVIGGSFIAATEGEHTVRLYGQPVSLVGNIKPTGTGLDQTLFFTLDTAREIVAASEKRAEQPLAMPEGQVSAVLLKVAPGSDTHEIARAIVRTVPGVVPIESGDLFRSSRQQLQGLGSAVGLIMVLIWPLAILLIGMVYLMAANERRRELGMLRALGATRRFICQSLLTEATLLAFCGASVGAFLAVLAIYLFRRLIVATLGVPFLLPSAGALLVQVAGGLLVAMLSVFLAASLPALKISRQDPTLAMRE